MTTIHSSHGKQFAITKGAPGPVLAHCSSCQDAKGEHPLADLNCQAIRQKVTELQGKGFYVLGVATKEVPPDEFMDRVESGMIFLGLLALIDPPRLGAAEAIERAQAPESGW